MKKGKIGTLIVVLITLVLAGVAIFTAIRLYQLRQQPVAPNAPTSQPQAAADQLPPACQLSFSLALTPSPSPTATPVPIICTNKYAYRDVAANTAGTYDTSAGNRLTNNAAVTPGQRIVYEVVAGPANRTGAFTITDTLSTNVTYVDGSSTCQYTSSNRRVTCTMSNTSTSAKYRVSINSTATGTIGNTATVTPTGGAGSTCSFSLVVQGSTPSPTPSPTPTGTPTAPPSTGTPAPTPTPPPGCNSTCTTNAQCTSSMICYIPSGATTGNCRNPSCQTSTNCVCATTPPAGTPAPTLPESGVDWPTYIGAALGILVIMTSIILAL
jgi:uncharacterized repeat protein (TIGR01451 family)